MTPFVVTVSILGYAVFRLFVPAKGKPPQINKEIKKDNPKVVDLVEVEDMAKDKMSYCRCWKSSKVKTKHKYDLIITTVGVTLNSTSDIINHN